MRPPRSGRPFEVLVREFFSQLFTSETVSSDIQLRTLMTGVVAFLLVPGILLVVELFFDYQGIVLWAIKHQQFELLTDTLEWVEFVFVTYSMVTIGLVAVFEWDSLGFDRRDAIVLGPLPVRGFTVVAAKTSALTAFLFCASLAINLPGTIVFAFGTADRLGAAALARHFAGHLTATISAAAFVFASMVILRGLAGLAGGPCFAGGLGTLLQFVFVVALLVVVILSPYVMRLPHRALVNPAVTGWLPSAWFMAVFEWIRGSPRLWIVRLSNRAVVALPVAIASAALVSLAGYRLEMRRALSPAATLGTIGGARLLGSLAHVLVGSRVRARAVADFILLTIARSRPQQALIGVNVAAGVAIVLAGLATRHGSFASLLVPRAAVLWVPFALTYATAVGLRAACFVPSELPAAWIFHVNGSDTGRDHQLGVRAATCAVLLMVTLITSLILVSIVGWRIALWHALAATSGAMAMSEALAVSLRFLPFTRPYEPGHAKLRTRWPLYVVGLMVFAYWPAKLEAQLLVRGSLTWFVTMTAAVAVIMHVLARHSFSRRASRCSEWSGNEFSRVTVLDIGLLTPEARGR